MKKNYFCSYLESHAFIPKDVEMIEERTFRLCIYLEAIEVEEGNPNFKSIDGVLYSKDGSDLIHYPKKKAEITLPPVSSIRSDCFSLNNNIREFCPAEGLLSIGKSAFSHCGNLERLILPSTVLYIGGEAFHGCTALKYIENNSDLPLLRSYLQDDLGRAAITEPLVLMGGFLPKEDLDHLEEGFLPMLMTCYLSAKERYSAEEQVKYNKYIQRHKNHLLEYFVAHHLTERVLDLLAMVKVSAAALERSMAAAEGNMELLAILLDYQHRNIDLAKEQEKKMKRLEL